MPFESQAQRAKFHADPKLRHLADKFERETPKGAKLPHYKRNTRNVPEDTFMDPYVESGVPFVSPDGASLDPNPHSSWGSVPDADLCATTDNVMVTGDGSVKVRGVGEPIAESTGGV